MHRALLVTCVLLPTLTAGEPPKLDYRVLATSRTSTMEKEMNAAAEAGYSFASAMGGESAFGGDEVIVVMGRDATLKPPVRRTYRLLSTKKTSTMQKELQQAGDEGFAYRGQTVFESAFGGREVAVIMERDLDVKPVRNEFRLLATSKTSTMQKELAEAGAGGFALLGMSVGKTSFGGSEVVCILGRTAD